MCGGGAIEFGGGRVWGCTDIRQSESFVVTATTRNRLVERGLCCFMLAPFIYAVHHELESIGSAGAHASAPSWRPRCGRAALLSARPVTEVACCGATCDERGTTCEGGIQSDDASLIGRLLPR